ncbi:T9SS type A sorting domain-containing protein [Hymenobacter bucti]|uniref:T9SS type A sorting domain-containing protein n=1 Tax=Hymenobacter bucti TaxID=1844114 RepID=A0ABW4QYH6_9BACT
MLAKFLPLLLLVALAAPRARAQSGCPDPQATNYNPAATANDGSCQYAPTTSALPLKTPLADAVAESSGLLYTGGKLWTLNDSGNTPELFRLDSTTGRVVQQVRLTNATNVDWEDLTASAQYVYVGDFGNNTGDRRDLRILRVAQADLGPAATTATAETIAFSYPDQTDFTPRTNQHNYDCEAFFFANDSLHLFTKNWADLQTRYYTVPAQPGTHVAHLKGTFNVNGLVTAAARNPAGTVTGLLGYNARDGATFVWLLSGYRGTGVLQANKRRIELPNALLIGQAEGLCFVGNTRAFVSNERFSNILVNIPPQLYTLRLGNWLPATTLAAKNAAAAGKVIFSAVPNPTTHLLRVTRTSSEAARLVVYDLLGRVVLTESLPAGRLTSNLDLGAVGAGQYSLQLESARGVFSQKVVVQ